MKFRVLIERASENSMKPIGQPIGGVQNPDWVKEDDKAYKKYMCKKCGEPLLGRGYNFPNKQFQKTQDGTHLICNNCQHDNFMGDFEGYITKKGKIDRKYFNRTTPVEMDYGDGNAL